MLFMPESATVQSKKFPRAGLPARGNVVKKVPTMKNAERFVRFLAGDNAVDRAPIIEWATWWNETKDNWFAAGLKKMDNEALCTYWKHDPLKQFWLPTLDAGCPQPAHHGAGLIEDEAGYEAIRPHILTDQLLESIERTVAEYARAHADDDIAYWFSLDGFFWYPRKLFGIENHLYAFYDEPELMTRMNSDLCAYHKKCLNILYKYINPAFMTFGEDMSYNLGPMLSKDMYDAFMLPYYKELIPIIQAHGTRVLIDTDGQVEPLIPWFLEGGIEGILPLERMAGVDVNRIRKSYPDLIMIGGFDKMTMKNGEAAMRAEFERIRPAICSGRYIPSVDHQTPPDVTLENYAIYRRLLGEYVVCAGKTMGAAVGVSS